MDWGIGVILVSQWASWKLRQGWESKGRDIGWVESIPLKLAILWFLHLHDGHTDCDITIHSDNTGMIGAFAKGCSCNIY